MRKTFVSLFLIPFFAATLLSCSLAMSPSEEPESAESTVETAPLTEGESTEDTETEEAASEGSSSESEEAGTLVPPSSEEICTAFEDPGEIALLETPLFDTEIETDSKSYCVLDENGQILLAKNPTLHLKPASVTKVLTALVCVEAMEEAHPGEDISALLDTEKAVVSAEAVRLVDVLSSGISPSLKEGEEFTIRELLQILLLPSTNTAGNVLAEHFSGTTSRFAQAMNERCASLGLQNSHFENAHGLDMRAHYSCAYDLAVILKTACENEIVRKLLSTTECTIPATAYNEERHTTVGHEMLSGICPSEGAFAGKTGWTVGANATLSTAYERDGKRLYVITMNSDEKLQYNDTDALAEASYQLLAGKEAPVLKPRIYDAVAETLEDGEMKIRFRVAGEAERTLAIFWNNAVGNAGAVKLDLGSPEDGSLSFTFTPGAPGLYTLQLFAYAENGLESGRAFYFLYSGSPLPRNSMTAFDGGSYFLDANGFLRAGMIELQNESYFADPETLCLQYAKMVESGENSYYVTSSGTLYTGWLDLGDSSYYFQPDARMAKGRCIIEGELYEFDQNGALLTEQ